MDDLQEWQEKFKIIKEKEQNGYIDRLYDMVDNLCTKANEKDYAPTAYERAQFANIVEIIDNMKEWF